MVDWNSFKKSIEDTFYNETINIYEVSQIEDGFGAVISTAIKPLLTRQCNIQNSNRDITKKEFGTDIDAKYRISLNNDINLSRDVKYAATIQSTIKNLDSNIQYDIVSIQPFNTYVLLFLKEVTSNYEVINGTED